MPITTTIAIVILTARLMRKMRPMIKSYPFTKMHKGDSFLVPFEGRTAAQITKLITQAARQRGFKITVRKTDEGVRTWMMLDAGTGKLTTRRQRRPLHEYAIEKGIPIPPKSHGVATDDAVLNRFGLIDLAVTGFVDVWTDNPIETRNQLTATLRAIKRAKGVDMKVTTRAINDTTIRIWRFE